MTDLASGEPKDGEASLAEIHREFREGLPARVEAMRSALAALAGRYDPEAAETFYRTAHSLMGTAPSFEAHELVEPAAALSAAGRRWFKEGATKPAEITAALRDLERLHAAVKRMAAGHADE